MWGLPHLASDRLAAGGIRRPAPGLFLLAAVLSGCAALPQLPPDVAPVAAPAQPFDRIPIAIRTSWPGLVAAIESAIPTCREGAADAACPDSAGVDSFILHEEDTWHPIEERMLGQQLAVQGSAWRREPLAVSIEGTRFSASLRLQYRVRIGMLRGRQLGSCGYGEPPRELTVRLTGDLRFAPEWYVDPSFAVELIPESRCRASMLNFDITDSLTGSIKEKLKSEAADAARRIREITNVRDRVAAVWTSISQPIAVDRNIWLSFNLSDAAVQPPRITADGRYVAVAIALEGSPKVVFGARPVVPSRPLPALSVGDASPKFDLRVRGLVTYPKASIVLKEHLEAQTGASGLGGIRIVDAGVSGRGTNIVASLDVGGLLAGRYHLFGVPYFAARTDGAPGGTLKLKAIGFTVESRSPLTRIAVSLFRDRIQRALEEAAWWDVTPELQAATAQFNSALNTDLSPQARLAGRLSRFGPGAVRVGPDGLEAWYQVGGSVEVVVTPF